MRLVTYSESKRKPAQIGVIARDGSIIDLARAAKKARVKLPFAADDMVELIAAGRPGLAAVKKAIAGLKTGHHAQNKVVLHAPIPRPRKNVFCVGWNYLDHFEEGAKARPHVQEMPLHPAFFTKAPTTVNGPYDPVPAHAGVTEKLDWEVGSPQHLRLYPSPFLRSRRWLRLPASDLRQDAAATARAGARFWSSAGFQRASFGAGRMPALLFEA